MLRKEDGMKSKKDRIQRLVRHLRETVLELERMFPGRHFTLDGHLIGSIGEVIAELDYGLTLLPPSSKGYDARKGKVRVQIKITQGGKVALYSRPQHLIVIKLEKDGRTHEIYNGPGRTPWEKAGNKQKNGQRPISLSKLEKLMCDVPQNKRIGRC